MGRHPGAGRDVGEEGLQIMIDLDQLDQLIAAATPAPWSSVACDEPEASEVAAMRMIEGPRTQAKGCRVVPIISCSTPVDDAAAIVALRNGWPEIAEELWHLRQQTLHLQRELDLWKAEDAAERPALLAIKRAATDVIMLSEPRRHGCWVPSSAAAELRRKLGK